MTRGSNMLVLIPTIVHTQDGYMAYLEFVFLRWSIGISYEIR